MDLICICYENMTEDSHYYRQRHSPRCGEIFVVCHSVHRGTNYQVQVEDEQCRR